MIDDETRGVLRFAARDMVLVADTVAGLSEKERRFFRDEVANAARDKPSRTSVFNLAALLQWAWGDALWSRD